jgi:hypothetical protein
MLAEFRRRNGIPQDEARLVSWHCRLGPLSLRLPNFAWRRKAILAHDLHHLLTAIPCGFRGECQMAAWEFGAGRMPHWAARCFCLPLVAVGMAWSPRRIWSAYARGRQCKTLHGANLTPLLDEPLEKLQALTNNPRDDRGPAKALRFAGLVAEAMLLLSSPALAAAGLWLAFA